MLAGFVTSFLTAAVELSATIMLVSATSRRADVVRHLPLHAAHRRARARRGARRDRRDAGRARHLRSRTACMHAAPACADSNAHQATDDSDRWQKSEVEIPRASRSPSAGRRCCATSISSIEPGEFFALLGPSGSGKSTLLRAARRLRPPAVRARCWSMAQDISRVPPWERDIGMVFQNYALWPHMTVRAERRVRARGAQAAARRDRAQGRRRARSRGSARAAARAGPSQLSGGQQQRVALARTIAIEPKVLLLDEPLSNLDAKLRVHMRVELLALQRKLGVTTIFVTHDQEEALSISDRVAVLDQRRDPAGRHADGALRHAGQPLHRHLRRHHQPDSRHASKLQREAAQCFASEALGRIALPARRAPAPPRSPSGRMRSTLAQPGADADDAAHVARRHKSPSANFSGSSCATR